MYKKEHEKVSREKLETLLKKNGWTKAYAAKLFGVTPATMHRWISGEMIPKDVYMKIKSGKEIPVTTKAAKVKKLKLDKIETTALVREIESRGYEVFLRLKPNE